MTPREYFATYIERNGGPAKVADALKLPYSTIAGAYNGSRGIGKKLAARMKAADPLLDEGQLALVGAVEKQVA